MFNALGNPVPINRHENGLQEENQTQHQTPSLTKPILKSLIQEMGFSDKTPEYQACLKILEAISPTNTNQNQDEAEINDLISPVDSINKGMTEILFIGKTVRKHEKIGKKNEDETTNEEQEKQT